MKSDLGLFVLLKRIFFLRHRTLLKQHPGTGKQQRLAIALTLSILAGLVLTAIPFGNRTKVEPTASQSGAWPALASSNVSAASAIQTGLNQGQCGGTISNTLAVHSRVGSGFAISNTTEADLSICTTGEVEVRIQPSCPVCPGGVRILFIHVESPEADWQKRESEKILHELENWIRDNEIDADLVEVAVFEYNRGSVKKRTPFTNRLSQVRSSLGAKSSYTSNMQQLPRAVREGLKALRSARGDRKQAPCEFAVVYAYTKHHSNNREFMLDAARYLNNELEGNYLIGCPIPPSGWYCQVAPEMATSRSNYSEFQESGKLNRAAVNILDSFPRNAELRKMNFTQLLAPHIKLVEGSATGGDEPPEVEAQEDGRTKLTWAWDRPDPAKAVSLTFEVKPLEEGDALITGDLVLADSGNETQEREAPEMTFKVIDEICSTPTPTEVIPTPTTVPSDTPTATPTPTNTSSPTITSSPTQGIWHIYLPFIEWEPCIPESIFTDVVLVLDMSTSMYRETRSGRSKHEAAIDAAKQFVDILTLEPNSQFGDGYDQIGIVGFNDTAWTGIGLTNDRVAAEAALYGLLDGVSQGTRLDLALAEAQAVVDAGPRMASNEPVIILLTDGLPNRVPFGEGTAHPECPTQECTVLTYAEAAKASGSRVFTIGLGKPEDILFDLMRGAASDPADFFYAPDGEDLAAIYTEIAGRIVECP